MDNFDIITSICQYLDDIEKFCFLSITKQLDVMKGKMLFNDPAYLYQIYFHRYFNQFTNIIVCDRAKDITLPNGVVLRERKPRFPKAMKKIEFRTYINYLYRDLFWECITHIKFDDDQCIPKFYSERKKKYILPQSLTHLVAKGHKIYDTVPFLSQLKYIDGCDIAFKTDSTYSRLEHISDSCFINISQHPNIVSLKNPHKHFDNFELRKICYESFPKLETLIVEYSQHFESMSNLINIKYLYLKGLYYTDISKVQFPPNLTHLQIDIKSPISYLPSTLIHLRTNNHNDVIKIPLNLPNLTHLVVTTKMTFIDHYFPGLYYLKCNGFTEQCEIPSTVSILKIKNYSGESAWKIPDTITHLKVSRNIVYYIKNGDY